MHANEKSEAKALVAEVRAEIRYQTRHRRRLGNVCSLLVGMGLGLLLFSSNQLGILPLLLGSFGWLTVSLLWKPEILQEKVNQGLSQRVANHPLLGRSTKSSSSGEQE